METITTTLKSLHIGEPQRYRNLTAFPLILPNAPLASYITLANAVHQRTAKISEISEGGSVPELLLDNSGSERILILDGEELIGAKQNRVSNLTILADAMSKTVIPVSCVEQGRWSYRSENFGVSDRAHFARGRSMKHMALSENMKATGTHGANQSMVWEEISAKQSRMQVNSPTSAMADMYEQHDAQVEDYAVNFTPVNNQVGVIFGIDNRIEGMDLFDAKDTLQKMLPKLTRSFAIDALETATSTTGEVDLLQASQFLDRIANAQVDSYPGVGVGEDIRLSAAMVAGGGLVFEDKLIHLAAFCISNNPMPGRRESDNATRMREARLRANRYARMRRRAAARNAESESDGNDDNNNGGGNNAA